MDIFKMKPIKYYKKIAVPSLCLTASDLPFAVRMRCNVCIPKKRASIIKGQHFSNYTFHLCTTLRFFAAAREPVAEE